MPHKSSRIQTDAIIDKLLASSKIAAQSDMGASPLQEKYIWPRSDIHCRMLLPPKLRPDISSMYSKRILPEHAILDVIDAVKSKKLRAFLKDVSKCAEVNYVMRMRRHESKIYQEYGVECLARAGLYATCDMDLADPQCAITRTAAILMGSEILIDTYMKRQRSGNEIIFEFARKSLIRLDQKDPEHAQMLRFCMGWRDDVVPTGDILHKQKREIELCLERAFHENDDAWY